VTVPSDDDEFRTFVPIDRTDILVRCNRCGGVLEGDSAATTMHTIWHDDLNLRIERARKALPQRFKGR
jgi:hypothetical protein